MAQIICDTKSSKSNWMKWVIVKFDWWIIRVVYCNGVTCEESSEFGRATWIMHNIWVGHCRKTQQFNFKFNESVFSRIFLRLFSLAHTPASFFSIIKGSIRFYIILLCSYTLFYSINWLLCNQPLFYDSCHFDVYLGTKLIWMHVLQFNSQADLEVKNKGFHSFPFLVCKSNFINCCINDFRKIVSIFIVL